MDNHSDLEVMTSVSKEGLPEKDSDSSSDSDSSEIEIPSKQRPLEQFLGVLDKVCHSINNCTRQLELAAVVPVAREVDQTTPEEALKQKVTEWVGGFLERDNSILTDHEQ